MQYLTTLFLLMAILDPSTSFMCLPCDRSECRNKLDAKDCKSGQLTTDECGCCDRCATAEGEHCGKMFMASCADYLYCKIDRNDRHYKPGVCKPSEMSTDYKETT